jgi:hypothetical protein
MPVETPWPVVASAIAAPPVMDPGGFCGSTADVGVSSSVRPGEAASGGFQASLCGCLNGSAASRELHLLLLVPRVSATLIAAPRLACCRGGVILDAEGRFSRFASQPLWPTWLVGARPQHSTAHCAPTQRRANSVPSRAHAHENHGRCLSSCSWPRDGVEDPRLQHISRRGSTGHPRPWRRCIRVFCARYCESRGPLQRLRRATANGS